MLSVFDGLTGAAADTAVGSFGTLLYGRRSHTDLTRPRLGHRNRGASEQETRTNTARPYAMMVGTSFFQPVA